MNILIHRLGWIFLIATLLTTAFLLRSGGLFRGLESGYTFHPDEPKQIMALKNFMEGRYVWYVGSLYYDGYPLGLNHIDEWVLRPAIALHHSLVRHFTPDLEPVTHPDKAELYYWARGLRVFYSMLCLGLLALAARSLFSSRGAVVAALALLAVAPLPITVAHFATGDIGANLFSLAAIVLLCLHATRPNTIQLTCAGLSVGLAFACKYHGALAGMAVVIYILLTYLNDRRIGTVLRHGLSFTAGLMAGVILGTPAFLVNSTRTWRDMRANFEFIRNYNVAPDFLIKPTWEKVIISLTDNTPRIIDSLGWMVVLLAFAGLIFAAIQLRKTRDTPSDTTPLTRTRLIVSIAAFPFLALLLSLTAKPEVQPFHFAFLQAPLTLAAVYALRSLWIRPGLRNRLAAGTLFSLAVLEFSITAEQDRFFWTRADTMGWQRHFPVLLQTPLSSAPQGIIKRVYLEPAGTAVFRNRAVDVLFPNAGFWNRLGVAPVPGTPLSVDSDWIFPNGPVFPLNDRMFRVRRDTIDSRQVVFFSKPGPVHLGVRSGSWPTHLTVDFGGEKRVVKLPPNAQTLLTVTPTHWRHLAGIPATPSGSFIVPLTVQADTGSAVVTVMTTEQERHVFKLFGGDLTNRTVLLPTDIPTEETIREIAALRYLTGNEHVDIAENPRELHGYRFPTDGMALPAGPYLLRSDIRCLTDRADVTLKLDDIHRFKELTVFETPLALQTGLNTVTSRFTKAFAPYETQIELKVTKGQCRLESWTLVPDTERIRADLQRWAVGGARPSWVGRGPGAVSPMPGSKAPALRFDNRIRLIQLVFPGVIRKGKPVPISCAMEFDDAGLKNFQDYVVFVHLQNLEGHTLHQFHFAVWQAMAAGSLGIPLLCDGPNDLSPGVYGLELGVYNARTERRLSIEGSVLSDRDRKKRHYVFGKTTLTE